MAEQEPTEPQLPPAGAAGPDTAGGGGGTGDAAPGGPAWQPTSRTDEHGVGPGQRRSGVDLEDALPGEARLARQDLRDAAAACEWCADQCADDPGMARCVRLCRDVADLADQTARLLARDSPFAARVARAVVGAAEECARECARHHEEHCRTCAKRLRRAADSTRAMLGALDAGTPEVGAGRDVGPGLDASTGWNAGGGRNTGAGRNAGPGQNAGGRRSTVGGGRNTAGGRTDTGGGTARE